VTEFWSVDWNWKFGSPGARAQGCGGKAGAVKVAEVKNTCLEGGAMFPIERPKE